MLSVPDQMMTQLVDAYGAEDALRRVSQQLGYVDVPPTITQFMDDSEYLGDVVKFYPIWRTLLREVFPSPFFSPYIEVCLTGSIGSGKSTVALGGMAYDIVKLLHLEHPQRFYEGVSLSTTLVFALINTTKDLVDSVLYTQLIEWFNRVPFFRQQTTLAQKLQSQSKVRNIKSTMFPKRVDVSVGSRFTHVLGATIVSAILSELNFQKVVAKQAFNNYTHVKERIESRFSSNNSPGRVWLDSSRDDDLAFLETHINSVKEQPNVKIMDVPLWEAKRHLGWYSGKTFKVFIGNGSRDPCILDQTGQALGIPDELTIDVPVELRARFETDIFTALRNLAGKVNFSSALLIPSKKKITEALSDSNPVTQEIIILSFDNQNDQLMNYFQWDDAMKEDPTDHWIHVDLGIKNTGGTNRCSCASTKLIGYLQIEVPNAITGMVELHKRPLYKTEWLLCIEPYPGSEVPIYKIEVFLKTLRTYGYRIAGITADGYQSTNLLQNLRLANFDAFVVSVDRSREPYDTFKEAVLEGRWIGPQHSILHKEMEQLLDKGKKIDHPERGSKDVADGCAGSVYDVYTHLDQFSMKNRAEDVLMKLTTFAQHKNRSIYNTILQNADPRFS